MTEAYETAIEGPNGEAWVSTPCCPRCLSAVGQWRGIRFRKRSGPVHRRCCNRCGQWFFTTLEMSTAAANALASDAIYMEELAYDAWIEAAQEHEESRGH